MFFLFFSFSRTTWLEGAGRLRPKMSRGLPQFLTQVLAVRRSSRRNLASAFDKPSATEAFRDFGLWSSWSLLLTFKKGWSLPQKAVGHGPIF